MTAESCLARSLSSKAVIRYGGHAAEPRHRIWKDFPIRYGAVKAHQQQASSAKSQQSCRASHNCGLPTKPLYAVAPLQCGIRVAYEKRSCHPDCWQWCMQCIHQLHTAFALLAHGRASPSAVGITAGITLETLLLCCFGVFCEIGVLGGGVVCAEGTLLRDPKHLSI